MKSFGWWSVSTDGDCEGRSPNKSLGIHRGHVDDIALRLADKAEYTLYFKKVKKPIKQPLAEPAKEVHILFEDCQWNEDMVTFGKEVFENRPVNVEDGKYFRSIKLKSRL